MWYNTQVRLSKDVTMKKGLRRAVDKGYKKHIQKRSKPKEEPTENDADQAEESKESQPEKGKKGKTKERRLVIKVGIPGKKAPWYKNPVFWILVVVFVGIVALQFVQTAKPEEISLGEAVNFIKEEQATSVQVDISRAVLELEDGRSVYAVIPSRDGFREALVDAEAPQANVKYVEDTGSWLDILSTVIYIAMFGGMIFFFVSFIRQMSKGGKGILGMCESRAKVWLGKKQKAGFKDVAGIDEAVDELNEIVEFLKKPKKFTALGARIPRGVLIVGPPGTGKTLLAKAIAGEAQVPFFFTSGSEFEEMLVGAGASRVRDLFEKAKKASPAIIFIDEMDAVGRKRGTVLHTGTAEQTLNQILVEMDGFDKTTNVIVIGATNRPDVLDPALLRPGRFDRIIALDLPDIGARKAIINVHAIGKTFADDVDFTKVARRTVGFSGADLENLLNESAILAARRSKKQISMDEIIEAVSKVQLGPAKKRVQSKNERNIIAYHEAGHALVSHLLPDADDVLKVSIVSRGLTLGATEKLPKEEHERLRTKSKLEDDIASLVAGHVSEKISIGEATTGAQNDIQRATKLARAMVTKYGMSDLGPIEFGEGGDSSAFLGYDFNRKPFSEKTAAAVDEQVAKIVDAAYQKAEDLLTENKETLDRIVKALLKEETLDAKRFEELCEAKG